MTVSIHDLYSHRNEIADWAITKGATCNAPNKMRNAATNEEAFKVLLANYRWANDRGFKCPELDRLKHTDISPWYVWLLESYCLGRGADDVVLPVIDLHKRIEAGEQVTAQEWFVAKHSASAAALAAARVAARAAARAAAKNDAMNAAWYAARDAARDFASWDATLSKLYYYITR